PHDVADVRPGHPTLVPDDGGLRPAHGPDDQPGRGDDVGQVPLEAAPGCALAGVGGGPAGQTGLTRTSTGGTCTTPSRRVPTRSGSWACRCSRTPRSRPSKGSISSTPPRSDRKSVV